MGEQFKIIKEVGRGAFGCVYQAINNENGETVAIKAIQERYQSSKKCYDTEVKPLVKLVDHPNIIKLEHVFEDDDEEGNNTLFLVFEYMHSNLHTVIRKNNDQEVNYGETEIKNWFVQLLRGLVYMHQSGYMHRDLKPSNLLVTENGDNLKIADFGSACEIDDKTACIDYVTTRWYRAPEVLFGSTDYGPEVDMWAAGTILAELYMGCPIFPGRSSADQIYKICRVLGNPSLSDIYAVFPIYVMSYEFPRVELESSAYDNIASLIPSASEDAISLIKTLCSWNPFKRPTAAQALQHPFFDDLNPIPRSITMAYLLPQVEDIIYHNHHDQYLKPLVATTDNVNDSVIRFDCQDSNALLKYGSRNPKATRSSDSMPPPPRFPPIPVNPTVATNKLSCLMPPPHVPTNPLLRRPPPGFQRILK